VPQIDVTFDIDANGILNVTAKDKGTNNEQKITITSSSGLSKDEVEKMAKDAEAHAADDRKAKDQIEARNRADSMIYNIEKTLKENRDKVSSEEAANIEAAIAETKTAMTGNDADTLNAATDKLTAASHKLAEAMYKASSTQTPPTGDAGQAQGGVCSTCNGSGAAGSGSVSCPQCGGTGQVTQLAGAMKFNLTCPKCNGKGRLRNVCPTCHGDGRIVSKETVEVRIPAGAQSGSRLRVPGKGNAGTLGAPAGDLYITTRVEDHPVFRREGDTIHLRVPISVTEAGLGAKIEVPTIDGKALLKIPPGTQNGQKFRMREKGVYNSRKDVRSDQIVEVIVQPPKVEDERTKEILRELAQLHPEDPRAELWTKI
jgi:curved DNA-binding protein CbpA